MLLHIKSSKMQDSKDLLDFIDQSPCAYWAVENAKKKLLDQDFKPLLLKENWNLEKKGKYFLDINGSTLIAFIMGENKMIENGFKIAVSHTDSPTFKIKPDPIIIQNNYAKLNTEMYGGAILNTWLDRPLSLAGRILLKSDDLFNPISKLIYFDEALLYIPNVAIHLRPKINDGIALNKQIDMLPILSQVKNNLENNNLLNKKIANELKIDENDILDFDLFLTPYEKACFVGLDQEFISSARIDNLASVHASLSALLKTQKTDGVSMIVCYDNEEVGSGTKQGATSPFINDILKRISRSINTDPDTFSKMKENSFIVSADMAHAVHPNNPDLHDPKLQPQMNKGIVLKVNANQNYTTDGLSGAIVKQLANKANVKLQYYANRSDLRGGATLGHILMSQLNIKSADIGNPMLSMHSAKELAGSYDHKDMIAFFKVFFKS